MPKKKQVFEPENLESIRSAISGLIVEPPETIEPISQKHHYYLHTLQEQIESTEFGKTILIYFHLLIYPLQQKVDQTNLSSVHVLEDCFQLLCGGIHSIQSWLFS